MARTNDSSAHPQRWSNAKLMREARRLANLENFDSGFFESPDVTFKQGWAEQTKSPRIGDFIREQTWIYRDSWLNPILDEIERRFVRTTGAR